MFGSLLGSGIDLDKIEETLIDDEVKLLLTDEQNNIEESHTEQDNEHVEDSGVTSEDNEDKEINIVEAILSGELDLDDVDLDSLTPEELEELGIELPEDEDPEDEAETVKEVYQHIEKSSNTEDFEQGDIEQEDYDLDDLETAELEQEEYNLDDLDIDYDSESEESDNDEYNLDDLDLDYDSIEDTDDSDIGYDLDDLDTDDLVAIDTEDVRNTVETKKVASEITNSIKNDKESIIADTESDEIDMSDFDEEDISDEDESDELDLDNMDLSDLYDEQEDISYESEEVIDSHKKTVLEHKEVEVYKEVQSEKSDDTLKVLQELELKLKQAELEKKMLEIEVEKRRLGEIKTLQDTKPDNIKVQEECKQELVNNSEVIEEQNKEEKDKKDATLKQQESLKVKQKKEIIKQLDSKTRRELEIEKFNKMAPDVLVKYVEKYLISKNIKKELISISNLNERFGKGNVKRLIQKGYLIRYGNQITIGK